MRHQQAPPQRAVPVPAANSCCRVNTKADVFYYIGVTGSKSADVGAFKLSIDNTASAT
jgi:hypothetical protein